MKTSRICLVRHGETEWSRAGRHTSHTDLSLTEYGKEQARQLAGRLHGLHFDHVWSSPRQRAFQTCTLAGFSSRAVISPALREWEYGDYEGLRSAEIRERRPDWNLFRDGCPNGESPLDMETRVDGVIARIREHPGSIVIFAHGHFLRVLGVRWLGLKVSVGEQFLLETASICSLGDHGTLHSWNQIASSP